MHHSTFPRFIKSTLLAVLLLVVFDSNVALAERSSALSLIGKASAYPGVHAITGEELVELVNYDEDAVIFDVRPESKRQGGNIQFSEALSRVQLNQEFLAEKLERKSIVVIFYGDSDSVVAAKAAAKTAATGYRHVYWLKGGWQEWNKKGLSLN